MGLTGCTRRGRCGVPPGSRLNRLDLLWMATRRATPRRVAELLVLLLVLLLACFALGEPSGHAGNRGRVRPPAR